MDDKYRGTTVNERLYLSGRMDEFDIAIEQKNVALVIEIFEEVELTDANIDPILNKHGLKREPD